MYLQLTVNYREFNVSFALKLVIPSHDTHKNDVSEGNVRYLSICKEDPLALQLTSQFLRIFP